MSATSEPAHGVSRWRPTYGWWPDLDEYALTLIVSSYHAAVENEAEIDVTVRGYAGTAEPVWEHELGRLGYGEQRALELDRLELPRPPAGGGILEVHVRRVDKQPAGAPFIGMWIDARGRDGGGYLIPTTPIQGGTKAIARDDLQIFPGVLAGGGYETQLVILNPIGASTTIEFELSSPDGLTDASATFELAPWSAWRGELSRVIRRAPRLLEPHDHVGALVVRSSHKVLGYFGPHPRGRPLQALDHGAPIFG